MIIFNAFSHLGALSLVFAQVKEWDMLKLHKLIRASQVVACQIVVPLFYERGWQGVFKIIKNDLFYCF